MAKQYYQGDFGFQTLTKKYPLFKSFIKPLKSVSNNLYLEMNDGKQVGRPLIKTIADIKEYNRIFGLILDVKGIKVDEKSKGNEIDISLGNLTWRLYRSGGRLQNIFDEKGNAKTAKKPKTEQQEDAVRYLLESAKLETKEKINKAVGFNFDGDWHNSYERTFKAISQIIMSPAVMKGYKFFRDSNPKKPKYLNQLTDAKILPDSKDNWNPSDIWAVKKTSEGKLNTEIDKLYRSVIKNKDIEKLNDFVFKKFKSKELIGISLKQVTSSKATVKIIQTDAKFMSKIQYGGVLEKFKFETKNSYFDILFKMKVFKDVVEYRFRFRPRGASGQVKVFAEGQPVEQKTFDGAVSADLIRSEFGDVRTFENDVLQITTRGDVLTTLKASNLNKSFIDFVKKDKYKFVTVSGLKEKLDDYKIKRAIVLLYYIYNFEKTSDKSRLFKKFYFAAKKMNEFSSIHYKIF